MYAVFSIFKSLQAYIQIPFCIFFQSIDYIDLLHLFKNYTVFCCMGVP